MMQPAGFVKGRPEALYVMDYGLFRVHDNGRIIGICGFVIRTDAGETILIDSGFPAKYAQDAATASAEDALGSFGEVLLCTPDHLPRAQLARIGMQPGDVDLHVVTHTHIDHIGGLHDFPQAPILMAAAERDLPRPLYWRGAQPMGWPEGPSMLVEGDVTLGPGLEVLLVPGHAPGQLALMVDLPREGAVLLTSDAISRPAEIDEGFGDAWDPAQAQHHAARLMALARERDATVIYGHDPAQWPTLRKAPETYT